MSKRLAPATPNRGSRGGGNLFQFDDEPPSTTPAGPPPPSSAASFTPAGAPSASYLGSSMMRGAATSGQKPLNFGSARSSPGGSSRNPFPPAKGSAPLGRSIRGAGRQPSRLSHQVIVDDDDDEEGGPDAEGDEEEEVVLGRGGGPRTFEVQYDDSDEEDADGEADYTQELPEHEDADMEDDYSGDMWLNMDHGGQPAIGDESDLMMLATPAVNDRIRREAEDIFRVSAMRSTGRPRRQFKFAPVAKGIYTQMGYAEVTEAPQVILETETLVSQLYSEGVGSNDDPGRLDRTLGDCSSQLASLWQAYVASIPNSDEEHAAGIGPGPNATPFENATYLGTLVLRVNHTRYVDDDGEEGRAEPLPETLFRWQGEYHNLYPGEVQDVKTYRPGAAAHNLFWQTVFISLLQGRVSDTIALLNAGGWQHVRRGGQLAYTGRALSNVQRAVQETSDVLENCPGVYGNWEIWSSDWTLYRIRARGALDSLRRFAEGKSSQVDFADAQRGRQSMAGLARKAESQVPWDVYENLNIIFDIVLGARERILAISQDWCEATIALFGWWDEGKNDKDVRLSQSQSLVLAAQTTTSESYLDRLARSFQAVIGAFEINSNSPIEVGMACVFEDNPKGVIGILRGWSLPVATAVAEIASLGGWLPPHQPNALFGMEELDAEDLEVLGVDPRSPDEIDGIKDNTLIQYAQALVNYDELSSVESRDGQRTDGWELAIHVLGRMESPERSEETVGELVQTILSGIDVDSGVTVEKVWRLLNDLGMIAFAEETAEHYGEILAQESHRYGEAIWYYSLAHRPSKVREVMNLLTSYSLLQSTAYPPESELDDHLARLLQERTTTLEHLAKQDLEAAELVGKMLSGYATLRRFYALRDDASVPLPQRHAHAAAALVAVITSADDNIRGGLHDAKRGAVVSEDFLLALLGEALVLVNTSPRPALTLDAVDVLVKAVEDVQTVGGRVYAACDEFFRMVLQSAPGGLRGSTPADMLRKSTSGLSGSSSYVMSGSSMLASQLHRSLSAAGGGLGGKGGQAVKRGWDWRAGLNAKTTGEDVLRVVRLGLSKDLARLWVAEADGEAA